MIDRSEGTTGRAAEVGWAGDPLSWGFAFSAIPTVLVLVRLGPWMTWLHAVKRRRLIEMIPFYCTQSKENFRDSPAEKDQGRCADQTRQKICGESRGHLGTKGEKIRVSSLSIYPQPEEERTIMKELVRDTSNFGQFLTSHHERVLAPRSASLTVICLPHANLPNIELGVNTFVSTACEVIPSLESEVGNLWMMPGSLAMVLATTNIFRDVLHLIR